MAFDYYVIVCGFKVAECAAGSFLLAVLSAIEMALLYDPANINRVYYGTDTRAFSLLLGSWLGLAWPLNRLRPNLQVSSRRL